MPVTAASERIGQQVRRARLAVISPVKRSVVVTGCDR